MKRLLSIVAVTFFLVMAFGSSAIACNDGCTPGYWKQSQHFDSWVDYAPIDFVCTIFTCPADLELKGGTDLEDATLLDALEAKGGGLNALLRHAVAALLNSTGVSCDWTYEEIILMVNVALASGDPDAIEDLKKLFEVENEGYCPLN